MPKSIPCRSVKPRGVRKRSRSTQVLFPQSTEEDEFRIAFVEIVNDASRLEAWLAKRVKSWVRRPQADTCPCHIAFIRARGGFPVGQRLG